jgi:hypothetical protein
MYLEKVRMDNARFLLNARGGSCSMQSARELIIAAITIFSVIPRTVSSQNDENGTKHCYRRHQQDEHSQVKISDKRGIVRTSQRSFAHRALRSHRRTQNQDYDDRQKHWKDKLYSPE